MTDDEIWAIRGGRLDIAALPAWVDTELIETLGREFQSVAMWLSATFGCTLTIGFSAATGMRASVARTTDGSAIVVVPIGLAIRLDYVSRLLERKEDVAGQHIVDPDFYGDLPPAQLAAHNALDVPPPFKALVTEVTDDDAFWAAMADLDAEDDRQGRSRQRAVQADILNLALLFCAFHESVHVLRSHFDAVALDRTSDAIRRGIEVDADCGAMRLLTSYRVTALRGAASDHQLPRIIEMSSWHITYAAALVLGLFDIDRKAIGDFDGETYQHPAVRLFVSVEEMFPAFERTGLSRPFVMGLVGTSADAADAYRSRFNALWLEVVRTLGGSWRTPHSIYLGMSPQFAALLGQRRDAARAAQADLVARMGQAGIALATLP